MRVNIVELSLNSQVHRPTTSVSTHVGNQGSQSDNRGPGRGSGADDGNSKDSNGEDGDDGYNDDKGGG